MTKAAFIILTAISMAVGILAVGLAAGQDMYTYPGLSNGWSYYPYQSYYPYSSYYPYQPYTPDQWHYYAQSWLNSGSNYPYYSGGTYYSDPWMYYGGFNSQYYWPYYYTTPRPWAYY